MPDIFVAIAIAIAIATVAVAIAIERCRDRPRDQPATDTACDRCSTCDVSGPSVRDEAAPTPPACRPSDSGDAPPTAVAKSGP